MTELINLFGVGIAALAGVGCNACFGAGCGSGLSVLVNVSCCCALPGKVKDSEAVLVAIKVAGAVVNDLDSEIAYNGSFKYPFFGVNYVLFVLIQFLGNNVSVLFA
jgi:hypothetical protein